jgi:DNA-binding response OmpR family regulator
VAKEREITEKTETTEILIVTENEDIAELLPSALTLVPNTRINEARSVAQAEAMLSQLRPDLIVIDLDWPHIFDPTATLTLAQAALADLRKRPNCAGVPIIGLSSELGGDQLNSLGLTVGLHKPFGIFDFIDTVERVLKG